MAALRKPVLLGGVLLTLALSAFLIWLRVFTYNGSVMNGFIGYLMLPVFPLFIFGLVAVPCVMLRAGGRRNWLPNPSELLVVAAMLFLVSGLLDAGMATHIPKLMTVQEGMSRDSRLNLTRRDYAAALSLPSAGDLENAQRMARILDAKLGQPIADWTDAGLRKQVQTQLDTLKFQAEMTGKLGLALDPSRQPPATVMTSLHHLATGLAGLDQPVTIEALAGLDQGLLQDDQRKQALRSGLQTWIQQLEVDRVAIKGLLDGQNRMAYLVHDPMAIERERRLIALGAFLGSLPKSAPLKDQQKAIRDLLRTDLPYDFIPRLQQLWDQSLAGWDPPPSTATPAQLSAWNSRPVLDLDRIRQLLPALAPTTWRDWPASRMVGPLLAQGSLLLCGFLIMFGLIAFTFRQWSEHERLQHPLTQVPRSLVDWSSLRSPAFYVPVLVMVLFWLYQIGATGKQWHPLPPIKFGSTAAASMKDLYLAFGISKVDPGGRWCYEGTFGSLRIYPAVIAIAFLLSLDVGFSAWAFFFFGMIIMGWLYSAGLNVDFYKNYRKGGGGGGAMIGLTILVLWLGRHHYWRLLVSACTGRREADGIGVWGCRAVLLGSACLGWQLWAYGGSTQAAFWGACLSIALLIVFTITVARVIAESGFPTLQPPSSPQELMLGMGLPLYFPVGAMTMLGWLGQVFNGHEHAAGFFVQSTNLAEQGSRRTGRLLAGFCLLLLVMVGLVMVGSLVAAWCGPGVAPTTLSADNNLTRSLVGSYSPVLSLTEPDPDKLHIPWGIDMTQLWVLIGLGLVFVVVGLRRLWTGCILHPIGLVLAGAWPAMVAWGSLCLGWVIKMLVLRYGGVNLYTRLKVVAIGIIVGEVAGYALQRLLKLTYLWADWGIFQEYNGWPLG